jgi:hypothetical protein
MPVAVEEEKQEKVEWKEAFAGRDVSDCRAASVGRQFRCEGASMSTLRFSLRNLFRRKRIGQYGHIQDLRGVPFYEARPPWWARFTWGFIAADLLVT